MNETMTINGTTYKIEKVGQIIIELKGPRGRVACLGRNLKSGAWFFQLGQRGEAISTLEANPARFPQFAQFSLLPNGWILPAA